MPKIAKVLGVSIVIIIIAAGTGVFFTFQKFVFPERVPQIEKNNSTRTLTPQPSETPPTTLKELAAARGIRIGSNYDYELRSETYDRLFEQEFNAMTVGFFRDVIYPGGSTAPVFSETDERVSRATTLGMEVFGQTLVWFDEIPAWVESTPLDQVEAAMFKHIDTLVSRYAGRVKFWNVVNEAIDDKGNIRLNHRWAEAMGADYISKAFVRAHDADPAAILYYNEYGIESNAIKYNAVKALLKDLLSKGIPVHALGWQMHVKPGSFDPTTLLERMNEIADMGLDNYITELDVELPSEATAADYESQKQTYKTVVETFLAARRHKTLVVWGLRDGSPDWLTNGHPLLFDENFREKPAYFGVQEALKFSGLTAKQWMPIAGTTWQIQFASSDIKASSDADMYEVDMYDTSPEKINELHAAGKKVICYVNAGAYESWRVDAANFPAVVLGKNYRGWPGEKWLDIRMVDLLSPIFSKRIDLCAAKGFDGIDFDNVNGFENDTGFPLTAEAQIKFNLWLANESHKRGLAVGLKNDSAQVADLLGGFDFAITEGCAAEGWCADFQAFIDAEKAVFSIEYTDTMENTKFQKLCQTYAPQKYSLILKNRKLDAFTEYCAR